MGTKPIIWNYGGGKQSVAIGVLIVQGKLPVPERAVIADTGREGSSTWRYLEQHMQPLLDTVGLRIEIVPHSYSARDLYDLRGNTLIPAYTPRGEGQLRTFCSGEWKRDAVRRWLREPERGYGPKNPIIQWIGYSRDEIGRVRPSERRWIDTKWPLLMGYGITLSRRDCIRIILAAGMPEPEKSACYICPFKTNTEWVYQRDHQPQDHAKAIQIDQEIREHDKKGEGLYLHRSGVPLAEAELTVSDPPKHPLFGQSDSCNAVGCWT